jgi:alkanesulfonate monooxygenase SsuD/methylene tetrahydromethanopterin reductase-like flavin-dependent oxidoreductase (luciferase family)
MGRDPAGLHRCVYTTLNVNADVAQAEREMRAFVEGYYGTPYETLSRMQGLCSGTVQTCAKWLQDLIAAGAQTIVIRFGGPDQFGQLERCAKEVLPQVR